MITNIVKEHDLAEYLNKMWANDNMTPEQEAVPTVVNEKGDVEITVYPKVSSPTIESTAKHPWKVFSSMKNQVNNFVVKEEKEGYSLFYPALDKPINANDKLATENPDTHTGVVLVFFKGVLPTTTSTIEAATSSTPSTTSTEESTTTIPVTETTKEVAVA